MQTDLNLALISCQLVPCAGDELYSVLLNKFCLYRHTWDIPVKSSRLHVCLKMPCGHQLGKG